MPFSPYLRWVPATAGGDQRRRRRFPPAPPILGGAPCLPNRLRAGRGGYRRRAAFLPYMSACERAVSIRPFDGRHAAGFVGAARPWCRVSMAKCLPRFAGFVSPSRQPCAKTPPNPPHRRAAAPDCHGRRSSLPMRRASPLDPAPIRPFRIHALVACLGAANLARPLRLRKGRENLFPSACACVKSSSPCGFRRFHALLP